MKRIDMTLERSAGPERDDRRMMLGANPHDIDDVPGVFGENHGVRWRICRPGQRVAMLDAYRLRRSELVAETSCEGTVERLHSLRRTAIFIQCTGDSKAAT
jgi:hypothetical protein